MLKQMFFIGVLYCFGLFSGCSTQVLVEQNQLPVYENPFYLNPNDPEFTQNPALKEKLQKSVYNYFRSKNILFLKAVCYDFAASLAQMPVVNLHGDAHLEQYAITDSGRGLTDFDDAATGPPMLDWVRFAVSLRLACQMTNRQTEADSLIQIFLNGYTQALLNEQFNAPVPTVVEIIRRDFKFDLASYFTRIHKSMQPIRITEQDSLIQALHDYFKNERRKHPELPPSYFEIVQCGTLQMGIGSALDQKYLLQVQGKSTDIADDVILELKEVRNLTAINCIQQQSVPIPLRILLAESRIAYQPFTHLGYFKFRNKYFWIHAWGRLYEELKAAQSFKSFEEFAEVVFDAGAQLGKGHVKFIASPHEDLLRQELLQTLKKHHVEIETASTQYAKMYDDAWNQFRNAK